MRGVTRMLSCYSCFLHISLTFGAHGLCRSVYSKKQSPLCLPEFGKYDRDSLLKNLPNVSQQVCRAMFFLLSVKVIPFYHH